MKNISVLAIIAALGLAFAACGDTYYILPENGGTSGEQGIYGYFSWTMFDDGSGLSITNYDGPAGAVAIPAEINGVPVRNIWGFSGRGLTSVDIPDSVIFISGLDNNQLTSVTIPDSVLIIGWDAFRNNQLISVTIPDSVLIIDRDAFRNNQLISVTIPDSVMQIGDLAFVDNQLTSVTIPNRVTTIGNRAFSNNQLTSITIGAGVILDTWAFGPGFEDVYNAAGRAAGTYTRTSPTTFDWERQP